MGGLRPISDRSLSICFWRRETEAEFEPRRGFGCFACGARLSWIAADRCDRLAVRQYTGRTAGTVAQLRREQQFRARPPPNGAKARATNRQHRQRQEVIATAVDAFSQPTRDFNSVSFVFN